MIIRSLFYRECSFLQMNGPLRFDEKTTVRLFRK
jgi:hypothetical protein